jgi:hypothetical protein
MSDFDGTWRIEAASARASTPDSATEILITISTDYGYVSLRPTPLQVLGLAELLTGVAVAALENAGCK